jgi:tetratricopeptide (TPR) repeat protein
MKVIFGFMLCTLFMTVGLSAQQTNETEILRNKIESLEQKLHEIDKDNTKILTAFERQDKRIEDLNSSTTFYSIFITVLVALLTVGTTVFNVFYAKKTNKETEEATSEFVKEWAETKADKVLDEKIKPLMKKTEQKLMEIELKADEYLNSIRNKEAEAQQCLSSIKSSEYKQSNNNDSKNSVNDEFTRLNREAGKFFMEVNFTEALKKIDEALAIATQDENYKNIAIALLNKLLIIGKNPDEKEVIKICNNIIKEYEILYKKSNYDKDIEYALSDIMLNLGFAFTQNSQFDDAIKIYKEIVKKFEKPKNEDTKIILANTIFNMGVVYEQNQEKYQSICTYQGLIKEYETSKNKEIQIQVAKAMVNFGYICGRIGDTKEERKQYNKVIEKFGDDGNDMIKEVVEYAKNNLQSKE